MKLIPLLIPLLLASTAGYAQPILNMNNRVPSEGIDAPISYASACGLGLNGRIDGAGHFAQGNGDYGGCNAKVAVYVGPAGSPESSLILLAPACSFRSGTYAGYIDCANCNNCTRTLNFVAPGTPIVAQLRAWDAGVSGVNTYEEAMALAWSGQRVYIGRSGLVTVAPPQMGSFYLWGLRSFNIFAELEVDAEIPSILAQPQNQLVPIGSNATFSVTATCRTPLFYRWWFGTNALPGGTNATLVISNVQPANVGPYWVVVKSICSTNSDAAALTLAPEVDIHMVPAITISGMSGQTYQMQYRNEIGPTNIWLPLAEVTLTNWSQYYFDTSAIGQPTRIYRVLQSP